MDERRSDYVDLDEQFTSLESSISSLDSRLSEFEQKAERQWDFLADLLEGAPVRHFDNTVSREGGLIREIDAIRRQLNNGGVRVKLPIGAWVAIVVASIGGFATIISALISS